VVFDNTRIKRIAPEWAPRISFAEGARQIVEWFDADASRRSIDAGVDALHDAATAFMARPPA
jgi:hypothetical protein